MESLAPNRKDSPERPSKGRIITFYSYKGGTGRSMAVANVAWVLALNAQRVLVIDWDLEAPGIHRYFHPFLEDKELLYTDGLLDFVEKSAASAATSANASITDLLDYVQPLEWPNDTSWEQFGPRARVDILVAGRQGPAYSKKLNAFNWIDFYERLGGRTLLNIAKEQLREVYDYVLIDSRTGVSDTSGICTIEMPDTLVVCFTLNDQSIRGAAGVAESIRTQVLGRDNSRVSEFSERAKPFRIFPVPTRVEVFSELDKRQTALELAQRTFSTFLDHLPTRDQGAYWGSVQMAYFPFYAFEEIPAVFGDAPDEVLSLTTSMRQITSYISDDGVSTVVQLSPNPVEADRLRKEVLRWYLRPTGGRQRDPVTLAQTLFDQFDPGNQRMMMMVLLRLIHISASSSNPKAVPLKELGDSAQKMVGILAKHGVINVADDVVKSVSISEPVLIEKWRTLSEWIQRDQAFLIWRQKLDSLAQAWSPAEQDESALLRGKTLDEARVWLSDRFEELNETERDYIDASVEEGLKQKDIDETTRVEREKINRERELLEAQRKVVEQASSEKQIEVSKRMRLTRMILLSLIAVLVLIGIMGIFIFNQIRAKEDLVRREAVALADQSQAKLLAEQSQQSQAKLLATIQQLQEELASANSKNSSARPGEKKGVQTGAGTTENSQVTAGTRPFKSTFIFSGFPLNLSLNQTLDQFNYGYSSLEVDRKVIGNGVRIRSISLDMKVRANSDVGCCDVWVLLGPVPIHQPGPIHETSYSYVSANSSQAPVQAQFVIGGKPIIKGDEVQYHARYDFDTRKGTGDISATDGKGYFAPRISLPKGLYAQVLLWNGSTAVNMDVESLSITVEGTLDKQ